MAEIDARKLYLPAGYPSMYLYCVGEFHMSEDMTCRRIRAARAARQFPALVGAVAEGRLHLSAVVLLAPHLTEETATELLAAAAHRTRSRSSSCWPSASPARMCRPGWRPSHHRLDPAMANYRRRDLSYPRWSGLRHPRQRGWRHPPPGRR